MPGRHRDVVVVRILVGKVELELVDVVQDDGLVLETGGVTCIYTGCGRLT